MSNTPRPKLTFLSGRVTTLFATSLIVVFLDRITKQAVMASMNLSESFPVIKGLLHITYIRNTGIAFGLLSRTGKFLLPFYIAVIICLIWYVVRSKGIARGEVISLSLVLAGAMCNMIDRIKYGAVIDFIDLRVWPVFNVADTAISLGAILFIIFQYRRTATR